MPLNEVDVAAAIAEGFSPVCATCTHLMRARERGVSACGQSCGGPLSGGDFSAYQGPMTMDRMAQWCFFCAAEASYGVRVQQSAALRNGSRRVFGVCAQHLERLVSLRPAGRTDDEPEPRLVLEGASEVDPARLLPARRKSLWECIYEVEEYYAGNGGRESP